MIFQVFFFGGGGGGGRGLGLRACKFRISVRRLYLPAHEILARVANAQKPPLNIQNEVSSWSRDLIFDHSPSLSILCILVYASSEGSGEYAHLCRLVRVFDAR